MKLSGLTLSEEDSLKAQIFGCWSIPLGLPYDKDLLVRIKLELKKDGTIPIDDYIIDNLKIVLEKADLELLDNWMEKLQIKSNQRV